MNTVQSELIAVLIAIRDGTPMVLTLESGRTLPSGPLETTHRSLQTGMRLWVERQTGYRLGHVEQLYTFADTPPEDGARLIRISYMALCRIAEDDTGWRSWYDYFPWEEQSSPSGRDAAAQASERLDRWASAGIPAEAAQRRQRIAQNFGLRGCPWDDELVLQRYELLWEAGIVPEALTVGASPLPGRAMARDYRRILATAIARLRAKIRYRPVIFELLPDAFTLLQLQKTVEAVAGRPMHKQNFRRLIQQQALVEATSDMTTDQPGRPARLFRFRREVIGARQVAGSKLPLIAPSS